MNQAKDGGVYQDDGRGNGDKWSNLDTFWRQSQQDLLIDQMLGVRQREKSKMAPRFLAQAARTMELTLTETGKAAKEAGL